MENPRNLHATRNPREGEEEKNTISEDKQHSDDANNGEEIQRDEEEVMVQEDSGEADVERNSRQQGITFRRYFQPRIDGGWAWVVMVVAFLMAFTADGLTYTFGMLYPDFLDRFGENRATTSLAGTLLIGLFFGAGQ